MRAIGIVLAVVAAVTAACGSAATDRPARPSDTTNTEITPPGTAASPATVVPPTVASDEMNLLVSPTGVVVPVIGRSGNAWQVRTPCSRTATLDRGTPVAGATVVLDPGHGGAEPGAVSPGGLPESEVNLEVARHARIALEAAGVAVLLTRTGPYEVDLATRAEIAKRAGAQAFVSVHHNAEPDGSWPRPGTETYYQRASADSRRLAGLVYEEALAALSAYPVAWVADRDAGVKYRPGNRGEFYAILRLPDPVVSVLAEFAFISNPPEAALLARADVQEAEGKALARAIVRYLTSSDPGSGFVEPYPRPPPPPSRATRPCRDPPLSD